MNRDADGSPGGRSTLVVRIGPTDRSAGEIAAAVDAVDAVSADVLPDAVGADVPPGGRDGRGSGDGTTVRRIEDEDAIDRLLSERVQGTLRAVATGSPGSVGDLAATLDRPREAVEEDLDFLADLRIVSVRTGGEGSEVAERPTFPYGAIQYEAVLGSDDA